MSRVLLGLEDAPVAPAERARPDPSVSRLGGVPDWWPPSERDAPECSLCGRALPLVAQIYAPIGASVYHRTLYIFGCVGAECANKSEAWCCLRAQSCAAGSIPARERTSEAPRAAAASSDWLEDADDWGDDADSWAEEDSSGADRAPLPDRLGNLALDNENGNWGVAAASPAVPAATAELEPAAGEDGVSPEPVEPPSRDLRQLLTARPPPPQGTVWFQPAYISVVEEQPPKKNASSHEMELLRCYQSREGINFAQLSAPVSGRGAGDAATTGAAAESYESAAPAHGDKLLYKLKQRLDLLPEQIMRYCRDGGAPLPLQPLPPSIPPCRHCGGTVVFELQLLPTLVSRLVPETASEVGDGAAGLLEFGTVLIYTCRDSCWRDGDISRTETVLVQAEL